MKSYSEINIPTNGERFYDITKQVKETLKDLTLKKEKSGVLHIFNTHTSCALTVTESFEESAMLDMQNFLKYTAKRDLPFIEHTTEGPDDSPSHMKSILLNQSLSFIVDNAEIVLGTWQGIYLAEFRDAKRTRKVLVKYSPDR